MSDQLNEKLIAFRSVNSASEEQTAWFGEMLGRLLTGGEVIGLIGDLGAGKTCFTRGLAQGLSVPENVYISSPTFTLVNEYPGRLPLIHVDLYRLGSVDDLAEIGLDDYYRQQGVCVVEWFDLFCDAMPPEFMLIQWEILGSEERRLIVKALGQRHAELAQNWLSGLDALFEAKP